METKSEEVILPTAPEGVVEAEVIGRDTWGAIRALFESGRKKKEIARELGLDVKTVRKHLNRTLPEEGFEPSRAFRPRGF